MFNYLEDKLLKHVLGISSYTPPSSIVVGLSTTNPLDSGDGITEPSGNGYNRVGITFDNAKNGIIRNNALVQFPSATGNWGEIKYVVFYDGDDNLLTYNSITPIRINSGDVLTFSVGSIQIEFDLTYLSSYLANALLNHTFKNTAYSQPSLYLALSTTLITQDSITEPSLSAGYSRIALSNTDFSVTNSIATSERDFSFGVASEDWGYVYGTAIMDDADGGNVLMFYNFETPINAVLGTNIIFDEGEFIITLD